MKDDCAPPTVPAHSRLRRLCGGAWAVFLLGILGVSVVAWCGRLGWPLELACHFRVQYAVLAACATVLTLAARRWRLALVPGLALLLNLLVVGPFLLPATWPAAQGPTYRLLICNLYFGNSEHERVLDLVRETQADFLAVSELTPTWQKALEGLRTEYPYQVLPDKNEFQEAGLYSKHPLSDVRQEILSETGRYFILAKTKLNGREVQLLVMHPWPPSTRSGMISRDQDLQAAGAWLAARRDTPTLLLGDLNVTPFAPTYADLLERSGLRDSQRGFGLQPSWPIHKLPLRIPIDHCLVSPHLTILDRRMGPEVGSDHFPVIVEFAFAAGP